MNRSDAMTAYIAKAAPFARPILGHIRALMHAALPEVEEAMKWSMPFFLHAGKPLASMAAFKAHASFGFWRREGAGPATEAGQGMGQFGKLTSLADLPPDKEIIRMVRVAAALIDAGATTRREPKAPRADIAIPDDLAAALAATPAAQAGFEALPPGARREYLEWVSTAKQATTRSGSRRPSANPSWPSIKSGRLAPSRARRRRWPVADLVRNAAVLRPPFCNRASQGCRLPAGAVAKLGSFATKGLRSRDIASGC